jgi:hypothetical protein
VAGVSKILVGWCGRRFGHPWASMGATLKAPPEGKPPARGHLKVCALKHGPLPAHEFPAAIAELCKRLGIEIEDTEKGVFLLRIRLRKSGRKVTA